METLPQVDRYHRIGRGTVKVPKRTLQDLLELQLRELRHTGSKPTLADIIERALKAYKESKPFANKPQDEEK
jgi:hypothetical protein